MVDRRRLLYADTPISIVLEGSREWVRTRSSFEIKSGWPRIPHAKTRPPSISSFQPYENSPLKMFDYKASQGMTKHDFVMIMDYAKGMPGFEKLNYADSVRLAEFSQVIQRLSGVLLSSGVRSGLRYQFGVLYV